MAEVILTCPICQAKNPRPLPYSMVDPDQCAACGESFQKAQPMEKRDPVDIEGSIYIGFDACLVRGGKTVAQVVTYEDAVAIAAALNAATDSKLQKAQIAGDGPTRAENARVAVEGMREALEPFAKAAENCRIPISGEASRWLTWDDFERARVAFYTVSATCDGAITPRCAPSVTQNISEALARADRARKVPYEGGIWEGASFCEKSFVRIRAEDYDTLRAALTPVIGEA